MIKQVFQIRVGGNLNALIPLGTRLWIFFRLHQRNCPRRHFRVGTTFVRSSRVFLRD